MSENIKHILIPPLIVQPLVENAVIHGIERYSSAGLITIHGWCDEEQWFLSVEDDGKGMEPEALAHLQQSLSEPLGEEMGCGLWNVHQRLTLRFGEQSGVHLSPSELGGLKVTLSWTQNKGTNIQE